MILAALSAAVFGAVQRPLAVRKIIVLNVDDDEGALMRSVSFHSFRGRSQSVDGQTISEAAWCGSAKLTLSRPKLTNEPDLPAEIGILLYPNVQLAAVYGLTDLFYLANRFATARQLSGGPALRVSHWRGMEPPRRQSSAYSIRRPAFRDRPPRLSCLRASENR